MKNTLLLLLLTVLYLSANAQSKQNKLLDKLINKIVLAPIPAKYIEKKIGVTEKNSEGRFVLNPARYPDYGIALKQPIIGQYNILIIDAAKFQNFKNKFIAFDNDHTLFDFIAQNAEPNHYELIKKETGRFTENRLLLKYKNYEIQSSPITDEEAQTIDMENINAELLKRLKIDWIWFIYNENTPLLAILPKPLQMTKS